MKAGGFEKAESVWSFRRCIQEKYDTGMDEFTGRHLNQTDYAFFRESSKR